MPSSSFFFWYIHVAVVILVLNLQCTRCLFAEPRETRGHEALFNLRNVYRSGCVAVATSSSSLASVTSSITLDYRTVPVR